MRRGQTLLLIGLATLVLSGCFRYQSAISVDEDGSGRAQEVLLFDRSALGSLFESDSQIDQHLPRAADFDLPAWAHLRDYREGPFQGVVTDIVFDSPEQLNDRLNALHLTLVRSVGGQATTEVDLQRVRDGWTFSMQTTKIAELPHLPGLQGPTNPLLGQLYHGAQLVLSVRLPGRVVQHNADELVHDQFVWRLSAQSVQTQAFARTATSGALSNSVTTSRPWQLATAAASAGGLAVFCAVALSQRRSRAEPPTVSPHGEHRIGDRHPEDPGPPSRWPYQPPAQPPGLPPRHADQPPSR